MPPVKSKKSSRSSGRRRTWSGSGRDPILGARLRRLRAAMKREAVSHLLVTNANDVAYLTGFLGGDSWLLVGRGKPVLISDSRFDEELEPVRPNAKVVIRTGPMLGAVKGVVGDASPERLGIQAEHVTVAQRQALRKSIGRVSLVDTTGMVGQLRVLKDEAEVRLIRRAARIQEQALEAVLRAGVVGQTELELAAMLEAAMKAMGSTEPAFTSIVASGPTGSLPHYRPARRKIAKNRPILIDWGATFEGYRSDMTRVVCFGDWPSKIAEIYDIANEAHALGAAALKPGATTREVDAAARDHIAAAGYGPQFGHSLGHGIGLDVHEAPSLSASGPERELEVGMVVTIEPGIYLPGVGGVRIEDDYVVTPRGARRLSTLPRDRKWATR